VIPDIHAVTSLVPLSAKPRLAFSSLYLCHVPVMTPCSLVYDSRHFGVMFGLHLQVKSYTETVCTSETSVTTVCCYNPECCHIHVLRQKRPKLRLTC